MRPGGADWLEGLVAMAKALATLDQSDMRLWEAELYRLRGELLLQQTVPQAAEAAACFEGPRP